MLDETRSESTRKRDKVKAREMEKDQNPVIWYKQATAMSADRHQLHSLEFLFNNFLP